MRIDDLKNIQIGIAQEINSINSLEDIEATRIKYLGKKGLLTEALSAIGALPKEEKPEFGKLANIVKKEFETLLNARLAYLKKSSFKKSSSDITLPSISRPLGHSHIISQVMDEICDIFISFGFQIVQGPEIETEYNNFTGLNIPLDHPSRDAFDTFYLKEEESAQGSRLKVKSEKLLLRSHTSPVQIRVMKTKKPPIAVIVPGKVYRPDATDASHSFMFHQVEGFLVDKDIKFSDLKGILELFSKKFFGPDTKIRFRPHFFPFTEPSAEVDVSCIMCKSSKLKTCSVCHGRGWLEVLGSGMIHPNVFRTIGLDEKKVTGFAFGMGVERMAMLKHSISDIRLLFENDIRFLNQF